MESARRYGLARVGPPNTHLSFTVLCEGNQLEAYKGDPHAALLLGFNLAVLRTNLDSQLIKCRPVMEALDHGMEALFPYTTFHDASFDLFLRYVDGKLTFDEEQMLSALGIKPL